MPRLSGYNLTHWLGRLGVKNPETPEMAYQAMPVVIVGDHRYAAPHLDTADGLDGFGQGVAAGSIAGYQLQPGTAGGLIVHHFAVNQSSGVGAVDDWRYSYGIVPPNPASLPTQAVGNSINPTRPCVALRNTYLVGASYLITQTTRDQVILGGNFFTTKQPGYLVKGPWWVPNGRAFVIEGFVASMALMGHIYFTELQAPLPSS